MAQSNAVSMSEFGVQHISIPGMQISIGPAHLNHGNNSNSNANSLGNIASVNVNLTNNQQSVSLTSLNSNSNSNNSNSNGMISASSNLVNANLINSARVEQMATQAAAQAAANVALRHIMHNQIYHPNHQSHHLNPLVSGLFQGNMNSPSNANMSQIHSHFNTSNQQQQLQSSLQTAYRSHLSGQSPVIHFPIVPYMQRLPRIHFLDRNLEVIFILSLKFMFYFQQLHYKKKRILFDLKRIC